MISMARAFEQRYEEYERLAEAGKIKLFKRVEARGALAQDAHHAV